MAYKWESVIDREVPTSGKITDEIRKTVVAQAERYRGSVRIATGHFYTDEEYELRRRTVRSTPMP